MTFYPLTTDTWDDAEYAAIQRVIKARQFTMGPEVLAFEKDFARQFGTRYAVMVNSGSSANLLAIAGLRYHPRNLLRPGDEVIVPAVSWSTTYYPIHQHGLTMRLVDVDPDTLNLDLKKAEAAVTPRTRAVFAVNLLGNPNNFSDLRAFCDRHNLILLEDNCESMGATFEGRQAGTFGICGTFSTFFSHHISTMEGGVVTTDDTELYHCFLSLRAHGWLREQPADSHLALEPDPFIGKFRFVLPGYNLRPLEMSGAIGQEQLKKLPSIVDSRRANAALFCEAMRGIPGIRLQREVGSSAWFGFAILLQDHLAGRRKALVELLLENGIDCRPIVAGNFANNPVIQLIDHSIAGPLTAAEDVDSNGLFIGNHHYVIEEQILRTSSIVREFSDRFL